MSEALWGVIIGGGIGVAGSYLVAVHGQRKIDKRDRREKAYLVLGETLSLLDNLSPDSWALWGSNEQELFRKYADEWSAIRPRFLSLHALYPEKHDDIETAYTTLNALRVEVSLLMERVRNGQDFDNLRVKAIKSQSITRDLVNKLADHVGS